MGTALSTTQIALLEAIKASLFGNEPNYPADTDWAEVVKEAKAQTVLGIISPVIPVKDVSVEMGKAKYMRLLFEQDKLIKLLDANDIPCVILKGSAAAQYYPKPHLRAMGDVDFLVPQDKFEIAVKLLESNGYEYHHGKGEDGKLGEDSRHIGYMKKGIEFELHHHFSSKDFDIDGILEQAIKKRHYISLNDYIIPVLPEIENGLVLLVHISQHLSRNTLGLRQIIDWEMYIHNAMNNELWNSKYLPLVRKIGLEKLATNTTYMCMKYMGLYDSLDLVLQQLEDITSNYYITALLANGNFGRKAQESSDKRNERRIMSAIYNIKQYGFFRYFHRIGLNTWILCKKHPTLKPFAWVYGIAWASKNAIKANVNFCNAKKQIKNGVERAALNKRIGVKIKNK